MSDFTVLSNFGVRYFLMDFVESSTAVSGKVAINGEELASSFQCTNELLDVLSCNPGAITKDIKRFKTLNGGGWDSAVSLGQSVGAGSLSLIRTGMGNVFGATGSNDTFNTLKSWIYGATANGGSNAPKALIEIVPRGGTSYEATIYRCVPTEFNPGSRTTSDGQEYGIGFQTMGAPIKGVATLSSGAFTVNNPT